MRKAMSIFATCLASIALAACTSKNEMSEETTRCVEVITPAPLDNLTIKNYSGRVKESNQIKIAFKTGGQIERIAVSEGERVNKGQFLANIDSIDYVLGLRNYEIQYRQLRDEVERLHTLYENRSVSKNDYEKAVAGLEQLEIAVEGNRRKVAYTNLYAPASGVITDIYYSASELVDAGMVVLSLLADNELEVTFDIPMAEYLQRESFGKVWCSMTVEQDKLIPMRIVAITPKADNSQLYRVQLAFENDEVNQITPGMTVSVKIEKQELQNGVKIPMSSVCKNEKESFVWTITKENVLTKQSVLLGSVDIDGNIVVISGLSGDERVVKAGVSYLHDGENVRVLPPPSETNVGNLL